MKKILIVLTCLLILAGCSTITVLESNGGVEEKIGKVPEISVESSAAVGSQLFSQFRYWSRIGYRIKDNYNNRLALGWINVSEGDFLIKASNDGKVVYCTEKRAYIDPLTGPLSTACFFDMNETGKFDKVKARPAMVWFENSINPPIRYERSEQLTPKPDSFKYELLYQGVSKGTLRLSYREYVNDMARPSFFQDVSYDIASYPTEVTFKSVRLQILGADNNGIKYKVLSGFQ